MLFREDRAPGHLVRIYDPQNKAILLGDSYVGDPVDWQPIKRPFLPDGELLLLNSRESAPARLPLPVELVRLIIRAAAFMVPDRPQTHRAERSVLVRVRTRDEAPVISRVWFWTKPLAVERIAAVQLVTCSRDQGWVSPATDVCHSWFEWGVFDGDVPTQDDTAVTGNEKVWRTREARQRERSGPGSDAADMWRRTHGNPVAQGQYKQHDGQRVLMDDEMWDGVRTGAVIAVRACAQQAMWENDALPQFRVHPWKMYEKEKNRGQPAR
ncbi:hypothetical protein B0H17DRAFT_1099045 [Mycena rosella]|uniref:Uncharacterized protein n=1 Tax=Mycena rosella TaxID=1033263 RepID=A0AAD7CP03_MYCRO|nr:hypothetical protein B0H17DRAFT_1099045 [Mycena rosella]